MTAAPETLAKDRYHSEIRGFTHAARSAERDPIFTGHATLAPDYALGYAGGILARIAAAAGMKERLGTRPLLLAPIAYMRGWKAGACFNAMDLTGAGDAAEYDRGYADGRKARSEASAAAVARTGAVLSILRIAGEEQAS